MRREDDPRVKRAEDAYTEFEAEKMQAQEAIDTRRATEAARRGGGESADTPPEIAASSPSSGIGHIYSEVIDRAAQAPTSRAAFAPKGKDGSADSASAGSVDSASTMVVTPTIDVRQGDNETEDQVRQRITEGRQWEYRHHAKGEDKERRP